MTDRGGREGRVRTGSVARREPDKTHSTAAAVWAAGIAMFVVIATASGPLAAISLEDAPPPTSGPPPATEIVGMSPGGGMGLTYGGVQSSSLGSFSININAGAGLLANAPAISAFTRAAAQWEAWISDPITVNIDANMEDMGSTTIIGSTATVILQGDYAEVRDPMVADAVNESDDGIVAFLPTEAQFSASVPAGMAVSGLAAAKANLKALGFTGLDANFGTTDATITFNTQFAFDYDNSNGVSSGTVDFETVAAHELGHALGFLSEVDYADALVNLGLVDTLVPRALDLIGYEIVTPEPATLCVLGLGSLLILRRRRRP